MQWGDCPDPSLQNFLQTQAATAKTGCPEGGLNGWGKLMLAHLRKWIINSCHPGPSCSRHSGYSPACLPGTTPPPKCPVMSVHPLQGWVTLRWVSEQRPPQQELYPSRKQIHSLFPQSRRHAAASSGSRHSSFHCMTRKGPDRYFKSHKYPQKYIMLGDPHQLLTPWGMIRPSVPLLEELGPYLLMGNKDQS